jgi:acyl dehydratase
LVKRYLEDLNEGELLHCNTVLFTRESIIDFGKRFDPQSFHINENLAEKSIFEGLIASSLHTLSACTKVVVEAQNNIAILSGVGMDEAKMFNPVRPGDVLTVKAWWSDIRKSQSKPDRGFASIKCEVYNQDGQPIIHYGYQYLVACRRYDERA